MIQKRRFTCLEWGIFGLFEALCLTCMAIADLLAHFGYENRDYVLTGWFFFGVGALWMVVCALRLLGEEGRSR